MRIVLFVLFMIIIFSCNKLEKEIIVLKNFKMEITYKNKVPIAQKVIDNEEYKNVVDSIKLDSMFTYYENQLIARGKWIETENGEFIYDGWIISYDRENEIIEHREYIDYNTKDNIYKINQNIVYNNKNQIDTAESFYYNIIFDEKRAILDLKTLYVSNRYRKSYLIILQQEKHIDSIELSDGQNTILKDFYIPQYNYLIRTYYLKNGKKTNWSDMKIYKHSLSKK